MNRKKIVYPLFFLLLAISFILPSIQRAHASIAFKSLVIGGENNGATTFTAGPITVTSGDALVVSIFVQGAICNMVVSDSLSTPFGVAKICGNTSSTHPAVDIFAGIASSTGSDTITVSNFGGGAANGQATVSDYVGVTGFGQVGTTQQQSVSSGSFSNTVTLTGLSANSLIVTSFTAEGMTSFTNPALSNLRTSGSATVCPTGASTCPTADLQATPSFAWLYTLNSSCNPGLCGTSQSAIELLAGTQAGGISSITQCFGNCGTPPITLVNTNSTHTINFNTSLTIFYEFQSPLNGVINNVTTNMAKSYFNGQQVSLGVYTTLCNVGITPFTATCPGQQQSLQTFTNPVKGRLSISPSGLTVTANTWVAIAISAVIAGLDVNDTNQSVNIFQQNPSMPPILASASANGQSKMGLWAYLTGTTGGAPPVIPPVSCGADLLCTLINATCALTPTNCFIGAMLMAFAWSIATTVILLLAVGYLANSFRVSLAVPNGVILIIWFGWFMFFPAIVGAVWFTILMFIFFILAFASFSTFMLKGTSGFGGQTA